VSFVFLTRGYLRKEKYDSLLKRNKCISNQLKNKESIPVMIVHEGNITSEQQDYIKEASPTLNIIFHSVDFYKERENIKVDDETKSFNMGYRHMCSFWFKDMFAYNAFEQYEYILRIDEDCQIKTSIESIFDHIYESETNYAVCANIDKDDASVTRDMNKITLSFLKDSSIRAKSPGGPMSQMIGFNMKLLRKEKLLNDYISHIHETKMIYINRWGDLPLWGEVFHYILPGKLKVDRTIKYYHGSHNRHVNGR
jgi:hypothetical protein